MTGRGICSVLSFYTVSMIPSTLRSFSPGETIRFGSIEFIANRFGGLSPSPLGDGSGAIVTYYARIEPPLLHQTMMGGPIKGLPTTLNGEGRTNLPFLGRHNMEASPTSTITYRGWRVLRSIKL
jgi:hypothetical protein